MTFFNVAVYLRYTGSKEPKENLEKIAEDITNNFLSFSKPDNGKTIF